MYGLLICSIVVILIMIYERIRNYCIYLDIWNFEEQNNSKFLIITDISDNGSLWKKIFSNSILNKYVIDINNNEYFQYWMSIISNNNINRIDIVLQSYGGYIMANDIMVTNLINFKGIINIYVPAYAYSAAAMIALTSTNLFLNKYSVLGPVDPVCKHNKEQISIHSLIKLVKIKKNSSIDEDLLLKYIDHKKIYDENICILKKIFTKKQYSHKKISKIIDEMASGKYHHDKIFSSEQIKSFGIKTMLCVPNIIMDLTEKIIKYD